MKEVRHQRGRQLKKLFILFFPINSMTQSTPDKFSINDTETAQRPDRAAYHRPTEYSFEQRHADLRKRMGPIFDTLRNPYDEEGEIYSN